MSKWVVSISVSLVLFLSIEEVHAQTVFGPKTYNASQPTAKIVNENLTVAESDTVLKYKLVIINGDGADHAVVVCSSKNILEKIICEIKNTANKLYVQLFRVKAFELRLNGTTIVGSDQVNSSVAQYATTLVLTKSNSLRFSLLGMITSTVKVEIQKIPGPTDTAPPLIMFSLKSNQLINSNKATVTITDASPTTTSVFNNDKLVVTTADKSIAVILNQGVNNIAITSQDSFGQKSPDFFASQITVDTQPAVLTHNLQPSYLGAELPYTELILWQSNEVLQSLVIDGVPAIPTGLMNFSYALVFNKPEVRTIHVVATDLAGNISTQDVTTELKVDLTAPEITTNKLSSVIIDDHVNLEVTIGDESDTETEISVDDVVVVKSHDKLLTTVIAFPKDESHRIKITSIDAVKNKSEKEMVITRDTSPLYVNVLSPQNQSDVAVNLIEVRALANKPIAVARVNGQLATIESDQIHLKRDILQNIEGPFEITIEVVDVFGQSTQQKITVNISPSTLPSWTYEECPIKE